jgi:hypothetical protein
MNAIMSRKLRGKQDMDKSLHNFTKRRLLLQQDAEEARANPALL